MEGEAQVIARCAIAFDNNTCSNTCNTILYNIILVDQRAGIASSSYAFKLQIVARQLGISLSVLSSLVKFDFRKTGKMLRR